MGKAKNQKKEKKTSFLSSVLAKSSSADGRKVSTAAKAPIGLGYLFLSVPMYIFFFGWLKLPFAIILALVLTFGLYKAWQDAPELEYSVFRLKNIPMLLIIILIAAIWVYLSGIGKFAYQNSDHMWRNAVLEKLVNNDWPVIISETGEYFKSPVAMVYYFALWLPAALFGKISGLSAAHVFLYWWCVIGVSLVFILICSLNKKLSVWLALGFIFFSGLDAVGDFILNNSTNHLWFAENHIENWAPGFQMSSITTQLFWVFNQAIPAWLITLLLLCQKDNKSIIFIYSFSFMSCTLPAIGLIPILGCIGITRIVKGWTKEKNVSGNIRHAFNEAFTFQNFTVGLLISLMSFLFLKSNSTGTSGFRKTDMKKLFMSYLIFILLEFLVYYFASFKTHKKSPLYWTSLAALLIVPMISCGPHVDFVMRASIPSLTVLYIIITESISINKEAGNKKALCLTIILLAAGGLTAYHETARSVHLTIKHSTDSTVSITAKEIDLFEDGNRRNFFGEYQDSFFFKYLAKSK